MISATKHAIPQIKPKPIETKIIGHANMDQQLLRAMSLSYSGGTTLGECLHVAGKLEARNPYSWKAQWSSLARQVEAEAKKSEARGNRTSAADLYGRSSLYYHIATYFEVQSSPAFRQLTSSCQANFKKACPLWSNRHEAIEIPYKDTFIPGYFISPAKAGFTPCPTLILVGAFDTNSEELYFMFGKEAIKRNINILLFDGPGQNNYTLTDPQSTLQPDYSAPIEAAINYAKSREETNKKRISLLGISLGSYLTLTAAVKPNSLHSIILNAPIYDLYEYITTIFPNNFEDIPDFSLEELQNLNANAIDPTEKSHLMGLFLRFSATSLYSFKEKLKPYILDKKLLQNINTPIFCALGESEREVSLRQMQELIRHARSPQINSHLFEIAWGADSHCQYCNPQRFCQIAYDWLNTLPESTP